MIKLDDNLLAELGLASLPPEEKKKMLAHIYETLEMRVGMELAKQMSDAQLAEFEQFINRNDEAGALRWLETNFPNYKDVVAAEFEKLKAEIKQLAPQILTNAAHPSQQAQPNDPALAGVAPLYPQNAPQQPSYQQQPAPPLYGQPQQQSSSYQQGYPNVPQSPYPQQPQYQQPVAPQQAQPNDPALAGVAPLYPQNAPQAPQQPYPPVAQPQGSIQPQPYQPQSPQQPPYPPQQAAA